MATKVKHLKEKNQQLKKPTNWTCHTSTKQKQTQDRNVTAINSRQKPLQTCCHSQRTVPQYLTGVKDKSAQLEAVVFGGTQSLPCGPLFFKAGFHLFENPRSIAHHQLHWACFQRVSHVRPRNAEKNLIQNAEHSGGQRFWNHASQIIFWGAAHNQLCFEMIYIPLSLFQEQVRNSGRLESEQTQRQGNHWYILIYTLKPYLSGLELISFKPSLLHVWGNSYQVGTKQL